jgi:hypothetical protein
MPYIRSPDTSGLVPNKSSYGVDFLELAHRSFIQQASIIASAHTFLGSPGPLTIERIFLFALPVNSGVESRMSCKTVLWVLRYSLNAELRNSVAWSHLL